MQAAQELALEMRVESLAALFEDAPASIADQDESPISIHCGNPNPLLNWQRVPRVAGL
jgi:hypothetical protein